MKLYPKHKSTKNVIKMYSKSILAQIIRRVFIGTQKKHSRFMTVFGFRKKYLNYNTESLRFAKKCAQIAQM